MLGSLYLESSFEWVLSSFGSFLEVFDAYLVESFISGIARAFWKKEEDLSKFGVDLKEFKVVSKAKVYVYLCVWAWPRFKRKEDWASTMYADRHDRVVGHVHLEAKAIFTHHGWRKLDSQCWLWFVAMAVCKVMGIS